ncbi:MAG: hypothetical protein P1P84_13480 [Deferrisomatales bacterium]|nr:hypothetical protein [Deferrisomatales bacterium]
MDDVYRPIVRWCQSLRGPFWNASHPGAAEALPAWKGSDTGEGTEAKQSGGVSGMELAAGVLLCWGETARFRSHGTREELDFYLLALLDDIRERTGQPSLEELVLRAAGVVREDDIRAASWVLESALRVLPDSTHVRGDLIANTWVLFEAGATPHPREALLRIVQLYESLVPGEVIAHQREVLEYAYLASLHLTGAAERMKVHWENGVGSHIEDPLRLEGVRRMLAASDLPPEALYVLNQRDRLATWTAPNPAEPV